MAKYAGVVLAFAHIELVAKLNINQLSPIKIDMTGNSVASSTKQTSKEKHYFYILGAKLKHKIEMVFGDLANLLIHGAIANQIEHKSAVNKSPIQMAITENSVTNS